MSQTCVAGCGHPTAGSALCRPCEEAFVADVAELAGLADDLKTSIIRQAVFTQRYGGGSRSTTAPLPFNERAVRARAALHAAAWRWTLLLWDGTEQLPTGATANLSGIGRWLHQRTNRLLDHPQLAELVGSVHREVGRARAVVDRPASLFLGMCSVRGENDEECQAWLFAHPDQGFVRCRQCRANHNVDERRAVLEAAVEEVLATTDEIAAAVRWIGTSVKEERIRKWASRERIQKRGEIVVHGRRRPLYRIGDVLDLLREDIGRQEANTP